MTLITIETTHVEREGSKVNCVDRTVKRVKILGVTVSKKVIYYPKYQPSEWVNP